MRALDADQMYGPYTERIERLANDLRQVDVHARRVLGMDEQTIARFKVAIDGLEMVRDRIYERWNDATKEEEAEAERRADAAVEEQLATVLTPRQVSILRLTQAQVPHAKATYGYTSAQADDVKVLLNARLVFEPAEQPAGVKGIRRTQRGTQWLVRHGHLEE